jgi:TAG lipase / steryl ester hydrolase / phospholipase A2 / LPA acyltransferase
MSNNLTSNIDLNTSISYNEWLKKAEEIDILSGKMDWRKENDSDLFHSRLLKDHLTKMQELRSEKKYLELIDIIMESLPRHSWELNNSKLYTYALSGTKFLISNYFEEIEESINCICDANIHNFSKEDKLKLFSEGNRVHGNTALILSGGASFGIYHLGVTKALWEVNLLPDIISGSSMGAIVAASICTRSDEEVNELFQSLNSIHKVAIKHLSLIEVLEQKAIMDTDQLKEHIDSNILDLTFLEAFKKTGRILNISVSATRKRQKPKVLNYITSPNVLIRNSVLASCAIPGVFPPVSLKSKNSKGEIIPYMDTEKWIDGSVHLDVPMQRIIRLNNVSRSIVSQANPHVLPFVPEDERNGLLPFLNDLFISTLQFQTSKFMELGVRLSHKMPWLSHMDKLYSMMEQEYRGDINISYPMTLSSITKITSNPTEDEFYDYIRKGELATYPKISFIRDQLKLNKILENCIKKLKKEE